MNVDDDAFVAQLRRLAAQVAAAIPPDLVGRRVTIQPPRGRRYTGRVLEVDLTAQGDPELTLEFVEDGVAFPRWAKLAWLETNLTEK
jgi:hypothetical protein